MPVNSQFAFMSITDLVAETITDIQSYPQDDRHILSTSKDGTVRLWDVEKKRCLAIYEADATVSVGAMFILCTFTASSVWYLP